MDTELVMGLIPLAGGFLLDKILGDPLWLPHPVVGFGKLISRCERRGNQGAHRRRNGSVDRNRAGCANLSGEQGAAGSGSSAASLGKDSTFGSGRILLSGRENPDR